MSTPETIDLIKIYDASNGPLRKHSRVNMMKPCRQVERRKERYRDLADLV